MLEPTTAAVLATYAQGHYAGRAAVTRNAVGAAGGGVVYAGAVINQEPFYEALAARLAADAGLAWGARLPYGVETSERAGTNGTAVFVLNWNGAPVNVTVAAAAGGFDVIAGAPISADGVVSLEPWGVAVVRAAA
jgi:hypothetical protein